MQQHAAIPELEPLEAFVGEFAQRFSGRFSDDESSGAGTWETCHDGTTWEKDFDLGYRRVG